MPFQRRTIYKKCKIVTYSELKKNFCKEISFNKKDEIDSLLDDNQPSRVWLLYGKNSGGKWECLQVGQSKNSVNAEITTLCEYLKIKLKGINIANNSAFYEKTCPEGEGELYRKRLYSMIGQNYDQFKICFLDVDKYLGIKKKQVKTDSDRIIEICKFQYAEAKIAFETLAIYWRLYGSGIDGQTIAYINDNIDMFRSC